MSIKKKLGMALATTALGAMLIGGGTFALFTAQATNVGNTFTAGTVYLQDMTIGGNGGIASQAVDFSNLAPGDNGTVQMTVKNTGNLAQWVQVDNAASNATKSGALFSGSTPLTLVYSADVVKLNPGQSYNFTITYDFPHAADNSYQGAVGSFDVVVQGVQAKNNTNATNTGPISWN